MVKRRALAVLAATIILSTVALRAQPYSQQIQTAITQLTNGVITFVTLGMNASSYINWGTARQASGYGLRDNAGVIEVKNSGGSWTPATPSGGSAPADAQYWVGAAHAGLSAEKNLGALSTALVVNTAGVPSAYAGTSCTNQFPRSLSAVGAATCASVALATDVSGTLLTTNGGTGFATYTVGDLLQGAGGNTLSKLAAVATGNVLLSGGVGVASAWGKVGLTTHVSGTLPVANGGTNRVNPPVVMTTTFEDAARFTATAVSGGTVTFNTSGVSLNSSATISSSETLQWALIVSSNGGSLFTTYPTDVSFSLLFNPLGTDFQAFVGLGLPTTNGAGMTFTADHIGFKIVRAASGTTSLFATQAGGTETASSALTTVVASDQLDLAFTVDSAASVSYYWRKNSGAWSAATTLTTNIPTAAVNFVGAGVSNAGVATQTAIILRSASVTR